LDLAAAEAALEKLGAELGLGPAVGLSAAQSAALGLVDVVQAHMARALRVISLERGHDPAEFVLVAFGGAAGLHACDLAREVGVRRVLVPAAASALSALGMLAAEAVFPTVQSVLLPETEPFDSLEHAFEPLLAAAVQDLERDGVPASRRTFQRSLDVRYQGQSFEIHVPLTRDFRRSFDRLHEEAFGYSDADWPVEIVNLRLLAIGTRDPWQIPLAQSISDLPEVRPSRRIRTVLKGGPVELPLYLSPLPDGLEIQGPAIVGLSDSTVLLTSADRGRVDPWSNLRIEVGSA
jgi:N-methylhydantoinase A